MQAVISTSCLQVTTSTFSSQKLRSLCRVSACKPDTIAGAETMSNERSKTPTVLKAAHFAHICAVKICAHAGCHDAWVQARKSLASFMTNFLTWLQHPYISLMYLEHVACTCMATLHGLLSFRQTTHTCLNDTMTSCLDAWVLRSRSAS